ncbi:MAG: hypothetical protein ACYC6W_10305 [Nitrosotalea sp.]
MNELEHRILDILSREIGNPMSISGLAKKIQNVFGSGDYKNINVAINNMHKNKLINLEQSGKSYITSLNFENYFLIDLLAEMELGRKQNFLTDRQELQMLMLEIDTYLRPIPLLRSITMVNPERNSRLNRIELVINMGKTDDIKLINENTLAIHLIIDTLQKMHNIKIDCMIIHYNIFLNLLKANEANPIREMMYDKIVIFNPQYFWSEIRDTIQNGIKVITEEIETSPAKISESDRVYGLARFGYKEIGPQIKQGKMICIEYIIASLFFHKDVRRREAIPIILAKNIDKIDYDILLFLAHKYKFEGKMLGILKSLRNIIPHGDLLGNSIRLLEATRIEETKADSKAMREKLRLYNVIR